MYLQELSDKIWKTKNARFLAAQRMRRSHNGSTTSVALLSASIIGINMLALYNINNSDKTLITIATVILSILALVMSLLVGQLRYEYRANNYHQCGRDLDNLNQRLKIRIQEILAQAHNLNDATSPKEDNAKYLEEYNSILGSYNLNHTEFDYQYSLMKAETDKDHGFLKPLIYWCKWNLFDVYTIYWFIAIAPLVAVVGCIFSILKPFN